MCQTCCKSNLEREGKIEKIERLLNEPWFKKLIVNDKHLEFEMESSKASPKPLF